MRKFYVILWLIGFLGASSLAQTQTLYQMITIQLNDSVTLAKIASCGIAAEEMNYVSANKIQTPADDHARSELTKRNITFVVTIADLEAFYKDQCQKNALKLKELKGAMRSMGAAIGFADPVNMKYGSMGGFYTFAQILQDLDLMRSKYSGIISQRSSIATTYNGNQLWIAKISSSPEGDNGKPSAFFDASHHAREPGAMAATMYAMWYLLENYGTDPECTYLVDNRQLYFLPMVNADGYLYNEQIAPNGGGMWRKNRSPADGGNYGVDLNRNYSYQWGCDNDGSSPDPASETYRGPSPLSEYESNRIANFCATHAIKTNMSVHTYSNLYLSSYNYANVHPPTYPIAMEYSQWGSALNNYTYGSGADILYLSNGDFGDYLTHDLNVMAISPEIGDTKSGFWPPVDSIFPQMRANLRMFLHMFWCAGAKVECVSQSLPGAVMVSGANVISVDLTNKGMSLSEPITLTLASSDPYITVTDDSKDVGTIASRSDIVPQMRFSVSASCPDGYTAALTLTVNQGSFQRSYPAYFAMNGYANNLLFQRNGVTKTYMNTSGDCFYTTSAARQSSTKGFLFAGASGRNFSFNDAGSILFKGTLFEQFQGARMAGETGSLRIMHNSLPIFNGTDLCNLEISGVKHGD